MRRLASPNLILLTLPVDLLGRATVAIQDAPEYGPAKGTSRAAARWETGILEKFIELAGGPDAKFVIVPTAGGNRRQNGMPIAYDEQGIVGPWLKRGLKPRGSDRQ